MANFYSLEYNNSCFYIKINYFPFERESFKGYLCTKGLIRRSYIIENKEDLIKYLNKLNEYSRNFDKRAKEDLENLIRNIISLLKFEEELKRLDGYLKSKFNF